MNIRYRSAASGDAAALSRIFETSFCDTFAHLYKEEDLASFLEGFSVAHWEEQLRDPAFDFRIAEADGTPIGYLKLGPVKIPVEPEGPAILLDQLYVLKEYHGSGIAHRLMAWALDEAARCSAREVYLTVYVDNHRAKRFYDRYGFEPVGQYAFMVGNHADEDIILRKLL